MLILFKFCLALATYLNNAKDSMKDTHAVIVSLAVIGRPEPIMPA